MEITQRVHLLEEMKGSYVYLILGQEPVLVDTGMSGRADRVLKALTALGMQPTDIAHILLTHQDVDHIGNAKRLQELSGARLWAPKGEVPYIHGEVKGPGLRRVIQTLMKVDRPTVTDTYVAGQHIGDIETIPAPGHTLDHTCLLYGDVLLAGDLVTTRRGKLQASPKFLAWDLNSLHRSIREVGKRSFDFVCPAHGEPVRRGNLWEAMSR
ncbi:MAG: MBL fold metallo-hydrolase [Firmicutes bacterium]|nr:MBL fold metallo-hydrolase [Bacillota bacterium]